jgi:hypothetical protein
MTEAFQETLTRIKSQESVFADRDEHAVEIGVILPLLEQVGWDIRDMSEVYPQRVLSDNSKPDFDLQIGGVSRMVIEVKKWTHGLDSNTEGQLQKYCAMVKPRLAALTNGHEWLLYVEPWTRLKNGRLHRFLDFSINDEPEKVEQNFKLFLARDNLAKGPAADRTVKGAKELFRKKGDDAAKVEELTNRWNNLVTDEDKLAETIAVLSEYWEIRATDDHVEQFIRSKGPLVKEAADNPEGTRRRFPKSFTFKPEGEEPVVIEVGKGWNNLLFDLCVLLHQHHAETFRQKALEIPQWFSKSSNGFKELRPISDTGIYLRRDGSSKAIRNFCHQIVAKFGYPEDTFHIELK